MLRPANVVDLSLLRTLIRDGAVAGSLDRNLASNSPRTALFFASLRQALASGYVVEEDRVTGAAVTVAMPCYVYRPDGAPSDKPIGFGFFRAAALGYELWLTGLATGWRHRGHGRAMITGLLKTPHGRETYVVRLPAGGTDNAAMEHLLETLGYSFARKTPQYRWHLRDDVPGDRIEDLLTPPVPVKV